MASKKFFFICVRMDKKHPSLVITICHQLATLVMPIGDPRDGFFYPTLTLMIDSYNIIGDCTETSPALQIVILDNILK